MANVGTMYRVDPLYNFTKQNVQLPDVMYLVQPIIPPQKTKVLPELLELKSRQERLLQNLEQLLGKITKCPGAGVKDRKVSLSSSEEVVQDFVINANPNDPPFALKYILGLLRQRFSVMLKVHQHSSLPAACKIDQTFTNEKSFDRADKKVIVTLIWKSISDGPLIMTSPSLSLPIRGECNLVRLFGRLLKVYDSGQDTDVVSASMDSHMDLCDILLSRNTSGQQKSVAFQCLEGLLTKQQWLTGTEPSIVDALLLSVLKKQNKLNQYPNLQKWFSKNLCLLD